MFPTVLSHAHSLGSVASTSSILNDTTSKALSYECEPLVSLASDTAIAPAATMIHGDVKGSQ